MNRARISSTLSALLCSLGLSVLALPAPAATPVTLQLQCARSSVPRAAPVGGDAVTDFVLDPATAAGDAESGSGDGLRSAADGQPWDRARPPRWVGSGNRRARQVQS
jgi:hypothetical protein